MKEQKKYPPSANLYLVRDYYSATRRRRGDSFDRGVLANVVPYENGYVGSCRMGNMSLTDKIGILKFDANFNCTSQEICTDGEDPRTFLYKGKPYAYIVDPYCSPQGTMFNYKVVDLLTGEVIILSIDKVPETKVEILGKNWIPLVKDDVLYFVVTIDPQLCILRCDLKTGYCTWETPFELVKDELKITISRGSTPLIFSDEHDYFIGIGHRTHNCHNHRPYLYTLSKNLEEAYIGPDILVDRHGVLDALSIYEKDGRIFSCISYYPIQLGDTTQTTSSLYEVKINE